MTTELLPLAPSVPEAEAAGAPLDPPAGRRDLSQLLRSRLAVYIYRRIGGLALSFGVLLVLTFLIVPLIPGDPAVAILGPDASAQAIADVRERLHLNDPMWMQFAAYLGGVVQFDLGDSFRLGVPVTELIATKLPYTMAIAFGAIAVVLVVSVPLGMAIGVLTRNGRRPALGAAFGVVAGFLSSFPAYVTGTLLVVVFAIGLNMLPAGGAEGAESLILPIAALAIGPTAAVARVVRQETYAVLQQDYVRTARSHRLAAARLYIVHAFPNLLAGTLALAGLVLAGLLGGAIIIENVFNFPGLGTEIVRAITNKDYPVIQGIILTIGALAILTNLLIDIVLAAIDPRVIGSSQHG